jgi:glycosyltransferase involved in cell wall biosynthesis
VSAAAPPPAGSVGLVTVAIPTWNRAAYLRESAASVLRQSYRDLEILIGDNASTDETQAVGDELTRVDPRVRYIRHPGNLGMVGNWNALLRAATGEYFLLLSDDDLLDEHAVARLAHACARPGVSFAYGLTYVIDSAGLVRDVHTRHGPPVEPGPAFIHAHLAGGRNTSLAGTLYRLPPAERREPYPDIGAVCDFLMRLTLALRGDVACVPAPVAFYREHESNETLHSGAFAASLLRVLDHPSVRDGELARYAGDLRSYVLRDISRLIASAAARGRHGAAAEMLALLEARGERTLALRWQARLLGLAPVRRVAAWRRDRRASTVARGAPSPRGGR